LEALFDQVTSDKIRFVGNGQWWKQLPNGAYRNPDFKVTGQNKVIDLWGDYWHKDDDPFISIEMFHRIGIECLIFWEHEIYENLEWVLELTKEFSENGIN
jgi:hypothetical protein